MIESLGGAQWFSCLDLASGYWQVPIAKKNRPKTAFVTHRGQFQWTCLPFGVTNVPETFTQLMKLALQVLTRKECLVCLDDIIIMSSTFDDRLSGLRSVFDRLRNAGLKLKPLKCIFLKRKVSFFLGHVVSAEGIQTDPEKTAAVGDWPTPLCVSELKGFLGLVTYYRRLIPGFAATVEPLNCLPNQRAKTCARALVDNWVYRYGAPYAIHSDQGSNFESHLFSELCQMLEIKKSGTTAYHPAGNGQAENANKTIKSLLMAKVESEPETWDQHLGACLLAYRSSEHISTGYPLFMLMFGREMRLPADVMVGEPEAAPDRYGDYVSQLKSRLSSTFQDTREQLRTLQQRQKEYFD